MNTHTQTLWQPPKGYAISPVKVTTDCVHCVCASVCNMTFTPFFVKVGPHTDTLEIEASLREPLCLVYKHATFPNNIIIWYVINYYYSKSQLSVLSRSVKLFKQSGPVGVNMRWSWPAPLLCAFQPQQLIKRVAAKTGRQMDKDREVGH